MEAHFSLPKDEWNEFKQTYSKWIDEIRRRKPDPTPSDLHLKPKIESSKSIACIDCTETNEVDLLLYAKD